MAKARASKKNASKGNLPFKVVNPHAAGIDIGSRINWVSIGETKECCKSFSVFTEDHHSLCVRNR